MTSARAQVAATVKSGAVSAPSVDAMLGDLPTAHLPFPLGDRLAAQSFHGVQAASRVHTSLHKPRIRFVYFPPVDDDGYRGRYHLHLVTAEILLARMLAACAADLRPMAPALDYADEARATVRPPRGAFHPATLEYRRWHRPDGKVRAQPLTMEALAWRLAAADDLSMKEARVRVARYSHALAATDQAWLIDRRNTPLSRRPLNQAECRELVDALDGLWQASAGTSHVERANRQIALRTVAMMGNLLDEYVASPFKSTRLSEVFNEYHLSHLRQTIEDSRRVDSAPVSLLAGPKAWFAAKKERMRAEHQVGLAMSRAVFTAIRLTGRPAVAVVGDRLHIGRKPGTSAPDWFQPSRAMPCSAGR